jgi:methyl-accepting chemotaxis protein
MNWFLNMKTRTKLILGFGAMILLLAIAIAAACLLLVEMRNAEKALCEEQVAVVRDFMHVKNGIDGMRAVIPLMVMAADEAEVKKWHEVARDSERSVNEALGRLEKAVRDRPNLRGRFDELYIVLKAFAADRENKTLSLLNKGRAVEAKALYRTVLAERSEKIRLLVDALAEEAVAEARKRAARTNEAMEAALLAFALAGVAFLLLGIVLAIAVNRVIAHPLAELACAAEKISGGDLFAGLPVRAGKDEIGVLSASLRRMIGNLQVVVGAMRKIADGNLAVRIKPLSDRDVIGTAVAGMLGNLREILGEIERAAQGLTSAAGDVAVSTSQAAAGAASSSAAADDAAAAVEALRSAAREMSEQAQGLSAAGRRVLTAAQEGKDAAASSLIGIHRIREQAEILAESVAKLGRRNGAAADIAAMVGDLSQLANLLAVNAAIEAAKAGEQGRGFGAVAEELKGLTEQSRQAAAQVRAVLNDVRQAADMAAAAMDQVKKALDAGGEQAVDAEEAVGRLVDTVAEAVEMEEQMAASGRQHLADVDRIAQAVEGFQHAVREDATAANLVEQAVRRLDGLAEKLKGAVARFRM